METEAGTMKSMPTGLRDLHRVSLGHAQAFLGARTPGSRGLRPTQKSRYTWDIDGVLIVAHRYGRDQWLRAWNRRLAVLWNPDPPEEISPGGALLRNNC